MAYQVWCVKACDETGTQFTTCVSGDDREEIEEMFHEYVAGIKRVDKSTMNAFIGLCCETYDDDGNMTMTCVTHTDVRTTVWWKTWAAVEKSDDIEMS